MDYSKGGNVEKLLQGIESDLTSPKTCNHSTRLDEERKTYSTRQQRRLVVYHSCPEYLDFIITTKMREGIPLSPLERWLLCEAIINAKKKKELEASIKRKWQNGLEMTPQEIDRVREYLTDL